MRPLVHLPDGYAPVAPPSGRREAVWQFKHLSFQEGLVCQPESDTMSMVFKESENTEKYLNNPLYQNTFKIGGKSMGSLCR